MRWNIYVVEYWCVNLNIPTILIRRGTIDPSTGSARNYIYRRSVSSGHKIAKTEIFYPKRNYLSIELPIAWHYNKVPSYVLLSNATRCVEEHKIDKDIHKVKDNQPLSFNHVRYRAKARSVYLIDLKLWRKEGATNNSTILFFKEAHSPAQPGQWNTRWHTPTTTTFCVGEASPPPHNQQPFTHWQPFLQSSTSLTDCWMGRLLRGRGKSSKRAHSQSRYINRAREQCTAPGLTWGFSANTTAHRRLGKPSRQIRVNWLLFMAT